MEGVGLTRRPLALANWKMAMTIAESVAFVEAFQAMASDRLAAVDVVLCPPFTALHAVARALRDDRIQLGAQNMAPSTDLARTGEISAALLVDMGCRWVMLGHWEVRRNLGDDDASVNRKVHIALEAGLAPILLIGEARGEKAPAEIAVERQLGRVLHGCDAGQVSRMALVYEPEGAIGVAAPASPEHVAAGCRLIREWVRGQWGDAAADQVRLIYGGSVTPRHAADLLVLPELDGLGVSRRGRDPEAFAQIVRQIGRVKSSSRR
jgi:triosephosphate isomerase